MKRIAGIFLVLFLFCTMAHAAEPVLVVNKSVGISSIDKKEIRYIFLGKKTSWSSGGRIIPVALQDGDLHKSFLRTYVKKTPSQFNTHWKRMTFTGKAEEIRTFSSEAALVNFVSRTPGAIGYISGGADAKDAKTISVQ